MGKSIISEGKTTNEAIENGLKQLKVSKDMVDTKVLENTDKKSFFSILAPRIVKVEITVKDKVEKIEKKQEKTFDVGNSEFRKEIVLSKQEQEMAKNNIENFLREFLKQLPENTKYDIKTNDSGLIVDINNENLGYLIGYRGETLYAIQSIISAIAGRGIQNRVRVILDIEGYKLKREKTLEDLAEKVAKTVIRTKKDITLEPMKAYERKIIHSKLQNNNQIETTSIGEEPYRKVVISIKK